MRIRNTRFILLLLLEAIPLYFGFTAFLSGAHPTRTAAPPFQRHHRTFRSPFASTILPAGASSHHCSLAATNIPIGPILDSIPSEFQPLFTSAANATLARGAVTGETAHDPFRYEWGSWINEDALETLMSNINLVRIANGNAYDKLHSTENKNTNVRLRIAGGQDWDVVLHVLPPDASWRGRWPTGSWAIVKTLIGTAEIAALRGPDRNGAYIEKTKRSLRGGSDGSTLAGGGASTSGEDCIKYVGGPLRQYTGKAAKTILLEVVIRPPIGTKQEDMDELSFDVDEILSIVIPEPEEEEETISKKSNTLGSAMGMDFEQVGGLDQQLDAIARRVLASRANPEAARRLGVSHVKGILLSGPPGCGKTLLARELAQLLGAREPQIVNGPEILDRFIGEAERKVRDLFAPAEQEYKVAGDDSALHIIVLDECDAICRKRGSASSDTTGVRDSVVNQLLAKLDGVKEASNVLVVGLTNRPELLDPALLRPGRLEVQLRVELPDLVGRRDILRIHTRRMREAGGMISTAVEWIEDLGENGLAAKTEHFSGAELAGLVRSAASFALARTVEVDSTEAGVVTEEDLKKALKEVRPALGKQDDVLRMRFPLGISKCNSSMKRITRDLERFTAPMHSDTPRLQSLLLVGAGGNGGAGATALAAWAAVEASTNGASDYVRFVTALDVLSAESGGGDEARAAALVDRFAQAREMSHSLLVLDDVDQLCAGAGVGGYSSIMIATLRALLRSPPASSSTAKAGGQSISKRGGGKTVHILATTSRSDAACSILHELFDETIGKRGVRILHGIDK